MHACMMAGRSVYRLYMFATNDECIALTLCGKWHVIVYIIEVILKPELKLGMCTRIWYFNTKQLIVYVAMNIHV